MSIHGKSFDNAQRAYDAQEHPVYYEDDSGYDHGCDTCIFFKGGACHAEGEINDIGECPSFKD